MESIMEYLKRKLGEAGSARWGAIADQAGVPKTLPRKIFYGDRENLGLAKTQRLLDYFGQIERGERVLPDAEKARA